MKFWDGYTPLINLPLCYEGKNMGIVKVPEDKPHIPVKLPSSFLIKKSVPATAIVPKTPRLLLRAVTPIAPTASAKSEGKVPRNVSAGFTATSKNAGTTRIPIFPIRVNLRGRVLSNGPVRIMLKVFVVATKLVVITVSASI